MTPPFRVLLGFAAGALLLIGAAALTVSAGRGYLDAAASVERLHQAARSAGDLRLHVYEAVTRESTYVLDRGGETSAPYRTATADIDAALTNLRGSLPGEPALAGALANVTAAWMARRVDVERAATARREGNPTESPSNESVGANSTDFGANSNFDREFGALDRALGERITAEMERRQERSTAMQRGLWLVAAVLVMLFSAAYALVLSELRERRRLSRRLRQIATHDTLTGLPNRRFFGEWLGYAIAHARREQSKVGLLFINVDGVKAVGKLSGRVGTHALLCEVARRFRATAREGDLLARVGATEFALATPSARDDAELAGLAQRLRDSLTDPAQRPLADAPIGASIGIAFFPIDADDTAGIMAAADAAMFTATRAGDNRVAFNPLEQAA